MPTHTAVQGRPREIENIMLARNLYVHDTIGQFTGRLLYLVCSDVVGARTACLKEPYIAHTDAVPSGGVI